MHISYDGIVFDILLVESWLREAVFEPNEIDFLYYHHVIEAICLVGDTRTDPRHFPPLVAHNSNTIGKYEDARDGATKQFPLVSPNGREAYARNDIVKISGDARRINPVTTDLSVMTAATPIGYEKKAFTTFNPMALQRKITRPNTPSSPPWTDVEIRTRCALPRRQLLAWSYTERNTGKAEFSLVSPLTGLPHDSKHGPICTVLDVPKINGNSSLVYRLKFETWENPFHYADCVGLKEVKEDWANRISRQSPMLSNRWTMHQEPDPETYLSSWAIKGTAIFDMAILAAQKTSADQMRSLFMHPIPLGMVRTPPVVTLSPGGDAVEYEFADHEVMTHFPAGHKYGVISIDIKQTVQYHTPIDFVQN